MPTFLRYSKPRWTCTFSKPFLCAIQRATFGPLHIPPARRWLRKRLPKKLCLPLLVEQRALSLAPTGVSVPTLTETLDAPLSL
jgi:hypothetical protein